MGFGFWLGLFGWLLAAGLGVGWWIDHRGIAGIKSDLADAQREAQNARQKLKGK